MHDLRLGAQGFLNAYRYKANDAHVADIEWAWSSSQVPFLTVFNLPPPQLLRRVCNCSYLETDCPQRSSRPDRPASPPWCLGPQEDV